jgi:hypothetical protein
MKQLLSLFLFLLPCFVLAQYPTNGNQKITLGEQTTADGLVYRGLAADTTRKPSIDTMAYMVLDTTTNIMWHYKKATSNAWLRLNLLPSDTASMLTPYWRSGRFSGTLPVANGGTNTSTAFTTGSVVFAGSGGTYTQDNSNLFWDNSNKRLGIGTNVPNAFLHVSAPISTGVNLFEMTDESAPTGFLKVQDFTSLSNNFTPGFHSKAVGTNQILRIGFLLIGEPGEDGLDDPAIALRGALNGVALINAPIFTASNLTTELMRLSASGNVGIGQTTPTAVLHLKAGTAAASTAPLKFTSGVNLTSPLGGEMEFNGTNLFFSPSTTRHTVNHGLTGSATLNFPSTTTLLSADLTITVTGAADGDVVSLGVPNAAVNANTSYSAWVSAANTVTVRFNNYSSGTVDPASALFKVFVTK